MSTSSAEFGMAIGGSFAQPARGGRLQRQLMAGVRILFDWLANPWALLFCKLVIGFVSAYNIFLTIKYYETCPVVPSASNYIKLARGSGRRLMLFRQVAMLSPQSSRP